MYAGDNQSDSHAINNQDSKLGRIDRKDHEARLKKGILTVCRAQSTIESSAQTQARSQLSRGNERGAYIKASELPRKCNQCLT